MTNQGTRIPKKKITRIQVACIKHSCENAFMWSSSKPNRIYCDKCIKKKRKGGEK